MGNSQSNNANQDYQQHPKLGTISLTQTYNHHTNTTVDMMELSRSLHTETLLNDWRAFIVKINDSEIRQVILLPDKYSFQKHGMCSTSGKLNVSFQYFPYTLTNEIGNRSGLNKYFEEKQIWYLLYNLIRAANKFERINKKIGNIHPDNVLINSIGQVKVFAACSLPGQKNNFQLMAENPTSNCFLAPQQLANDAIKGSHYPLNINPCLAETFSIGLTVLTAGTLLQCQNLYQRHKNSLKFNFTGLESIISVFKQIYSQFLYDILESILQTNPKKRRSASQVYQRIYHFERQILNLQDFVPQKNKQQQLKDRDQNYVVNNHQRKAIFNNNKVNNVYQAAFNNSHNDNGQYQKQQQLTLNNMEQTRKIHQNLQNSKQFNNNSNNNLSPQLTGTFSFHHPPVPVTQRVIMNPPVVINSQRIISSPVIRFQSPSPQMPVQQSRSPPSIMPGSLYSGSNMKSRLSTSPIPNSKIIYQQTKILPPIRAMNSQIGRNILPVVSHIVKNSQNPQSNLIKNENNPTQNQVRNEQQRLNQPVSNQNISTIKTIPINSVIHNTGSNKAINNVKTKISAQGMFLPLQSVRVINIQEYKSSNKIPVDTVHQSEGEKIYKQQNNQNENQSQFIDSIKEQTPQNQIQTTQKQIPLDSKLISFQKIH